MWVRDAEGFYHSCPPRGCAFHTAGSGPHRVYSQGDVLVEYDDCPVAHVTRWTWNMMLLYVWLEKYGKTPLDMGLDLERMDPRYWEAMTVLRTEYARLDQENYERRQRQSVARTGTSNYPGME